ncbi:hypothetical protein PanWU01x14_334350 [Parasponia andersonii]|uniref:Uncharacterized protein n=1 Tax=Parasponia andersonii TaxID=3476 RepID=A0A2P5AGM1_PARAD|nr:hypothetical protein PanWU01x14_334350 [Parasponia andersonii]
MDEALYCLRKRSQKYEDLFEQKVAIVDDMFSQWITEYWKAFSELEDYKYYVLEPDFIDYVNGVKLLKGKA